MAEEEGFNEVLIHYVQQKPCLWDPKHPSHCDNSELRKSWLEIAKNLTTTDAVPVIKTRWRTLRDRYRKELTDKREELKKQCHRILGVKVGSTPDEVRDAFLSLAKRYHPDGASPEADNDRFQQVEKAYRKLQLHFAERVATEEVEPEDAEDIVEHDIRHTAPQHRQYLSFDGYGSGTPAQREKQHRKMRAYRATENIFEYRVKKINPNTEEGLIVKDKIESKKIKTRYGMDRLVEDLIQESMAKGDFDNLKGKGKPLQFRSPNPYVDFVTQKMNEILIDNGFTPAWITLQKEIRTETEQLKQRLEQARSQLGPIPLDYKDSKAWSEALGKAQLDAAALNAKINKYNLLVPVLQKQMLQFQLERETEEILKNGKFWPPGVERPKPSAPVENWQSDNILTLISSFFTTK